MTIESLQAVYFDTSLITTAAIQPAVEHHEAAISFCERTIAARSSVYFSELMRLEYAQALRALSTTVDEATRRAFRLHRWDQVGVRRQWMEYGSQRLDVFLSQFDWVEVALDRDAINAARDLMISCNLSSYDAAHVATALSLGITDLAAVDGHFERASHLLTIHTVRTPPEAS